MSKNCKAEIVYRGIDRDIKRDLEANELTTISRLYDKIKDTIPEFKDIDFILVEKNSGQILSKTEYVKNIISNGHAKLKVLPKVVDATIVFASEDPKKIKIDVEKPIQDAIKGLIKNDIESRYVLAFEGKNSYKCCCSTLPLYSHGWWYQTFRLLRRLYSYDLERVEKQIKTEGNRFMNLLLENARFAEACGLSAYSLNDWAEIVALRILSDERITNADINFIRSNISLFVSPQIREDTNLPSLVLNAYKKYAGIRKEDAKFRYLKMSYENGCQCAYIEHIKFKSLKNKISVFNRLTTQRSAYIFVSPSNIKIFKTYGVAEKFSVKQTEIQDILQDNSNTIIISLKDDSKWILSSDKISAIRRLFIVLTTICREESIDLAEETNTNTNESEDEETRLFTQPILSSQYKNIEAELVDIAQKHYQISRFSFKSDESDNSDSENNKIESIIDLIPPPPRTKRTPQDPKKKIEAVKYSEIIIPSSDDEDTANNDNFDYLKETIKVLQIGEKIDPSQIDLSAYNISSEDQKEIDIDKFFEVDSDEDWKRNPITIILLIILAYTITKYIFSYLIQSKS